MSGRIEMGVDKLTLKTEKNVSRVADDRIMLQDILESQMGLGERKLTDSIRGMNKRMYDIRFCNLPNAFQVSPKNLLKELKEAIS